MPGRLHYCSLHANISFAKALVKAFLHRAILNDQEDDQWKGIAKFSSLWEALEEKYGDELQGILAWHGPSNEPSDDICDFLKEMN